MSESIFASRATIGARYVTKGGWPVTICEGGKTVIVQNDLTGEHHKIDGSQLLWPYNERLISKEAITMARAKKGNKNVRREMQRIVKQAQAKKKAPRATAAAIADGTTLVREYNGKHYQVERLATGYRYNGEDFKSLTAVAKKITGYPSISGPAFFGPALPAQPAAQPDPALAPAL